MPPYEKEPFPGLFVIDCDYISPGIACAYLVVEGKEAAFVENNTNRSVPILLGELKRNGLAPEDVKYIIITHVHLDHAGGTGALAKLCPNAVVLAHPKAAKHLIQPERLIQSSIQVYGEENFRKLYGDILPVPSERVKTPEDREEIVWGKRTFRFYHTKGHANHHFCIYDSLSNGIFTGDSFGLGYREFSVGKNPVLYPSTTPTDFDYEEALITVDTILSTGADKAYLTHFGVWRDLEAGARQMKQGLHTMQNILSSGERSGLEGGPLLEFCTGRIRAYLEKEISTQGISLGKKEDLLVGFDSKINAQGLVFQIERKKRKKV
ncbi:MBL fold metallo-hydrolase [Leptospira gomenensis]|uniref:MBL fold metallo-hydrolase n=1 Tax=Leptospira gomenensis TaxID=2484974 RepID=A0A5F1YG13_9LEPT|nr:MBL fold metallo-hydrolase [Leptospira gomenensis]TGK39193.1 MBL fold metallo-hydrolase [Leptospira gomenensis]TGK44266.1 MBL fold metallo-hydrolase [Leptospira gomenensis]TGK45064.1 MBL fold metallo-hydrolase [Leptospira gomenensis]TGK65128.1 MBL fold metallo-hydrolase [Leptospira gomenensis]